MTKIKIPLYDVRKYRHLAQPVLFSVFALAIIFTLVFAASVYAVNTSSQKSSQQKSVKSAKAQAESKRKADAIAKKKAAQKKEAERKKKAAIEAAKRTAAAASAKVIMPSPIVSAVPANNLYVDPALKLQGRPDAIARHAVGKWFGGWNANIQADVNALVTKASANGTTPVLVAYNIPHRDCGSYSAGGLESSAAYRTWINAFVAGIGQRKAIVVLEPDALPGLDCLSAAGQSARLSDISYAVTALSKTGASTYLDAGNYTWHSATTMASRLKSANVAMARGFSLNVSGYGWTAQSITYGQQLGSMVGGKSFVIDTSRNGNGPAPDNEWCNPRGRALGHVPTTSAGVERLDAYLWIKVPGESDGTSNGGPSAGEWWNEIAIELIGNAR